STRRNFSFLQASRAWRQRRLIMDVVYRCCCGIDVHKDSVTVCVLWAETKGKSRQEKRLFATFTQDLLALSDWLHACGVTHVGMESTGCIGNRCGTFWKGISNCCWSMRST